MELRRAGKLCLDETLASETFISIRALSNLKQVGKGILLGYH